MDQTSPQGSILSPTFWRIFDKIFSQIYINSLQRDLRAKFPCIAEIFHIAYADDHVTIITILLPNDIDPDDLARIVVDIIKCTRSLLDHATKTVGCGINQAKSEVVLPESLTIEAVNSKTEITWLGYSLKMTDDFHLTFTPIA